MATKKGQIDFTEAIKNLDLMRDAVYHMVQSEEKKGKMLTEMMEDLKERVNRLEALTSKLEALEKAA